MKRKILYCTHAFPGDLYSEKVFITPDLEALRRHFDEIVLLPSEPISRDKGYFRRLPDGVSVDWSFADDRIFHSKLLKSVYIFHPYVLRSAVTIAGEARTPVRWIKGIFQAINTARLSAVLRRVLRRHGMKPADTLFMSMWFHDPAAALARVADKDGFAMATRAHTSDIFDEAMLFRSRRIRSRLLGAVDKVFSISRVGYDYFVARFPEHAGRFVHTPLGSIRLFSPTAPDAVDESSITPSAAPSEISFMTVARLDPIKRIDLILDVLAEVALALPDTRINYTLIGDGECEESLAAKAAALKPRNLNVSMTGALENEEIQRRLATAPPDWYIMMSSTEGLPVSMGEAMSYGVPVITTDVGQISELVTPECALMLPADARPAEYRDMMLPAITDGAVRRRMAAAALKRWEDTFDARSLASGVAETLAGLLPQTK